jgi:lipoprotein-releasing system permease protein
MGSLIGTLAAIVTLKNLPTLIELVSRMQGYEMFNTHFYGKTMPHELSYEALTFVLIATVITSLLAGIVPAVKASLLKPSSILKAE